MVCSDYDVSFAIMANEFAIGPLAKSRCVASGHEDMCCIASNDGHECFAQLVVGGVIVNAGRCDEFGMHEHLLEYLVYWPDDVVCPFCVRFLQT